MLSTSTGSQRTWHASQQQHWVLLQPACKFARLPQATKGHTKIRPPTHLVAAFQHHPNRSVTVAAASPAAPAPAEGPSAQPAPPGPGLSVVKEWATLVAVAVVVLAVVSLGVVTAVAKVPQLWQWLGEWGSLAEWLVIAVSLVTASNSIAWVGQAVYNSYDKVVKQQQQLVIQQQQLKQDIMKQQQQLKQDIVKQQQQLKQDIDSRFDSISRQLDQLSSERVERRVDRLEVGVLEQQAALTQAVTQAVVSKMVP